MSTGNTLAAVPSCSERKRKHESEEDSGSCPPKKWYYVLASESDLESDGTESMYSMQEKSTDLAKDTSDTCTKSSWYTDDDGRMIEFELVSLSEEENYHPFQSKDSSSSPEDIKPCEINVVKPESQQTTMSAADNSNSDSDGELLFSNSNKGGLYKFCFRCKEGNPNPTFKYCIRCYRLRKNFFPPRPRGIRKKKLRKTTAINNIDCKNSLESGIAGMSSSSSQNCLPDDNNKQEDYLLNDTDTTELCNICMTRPRDGGYAHGHIVHNYSCYKCSVKMYNINGRCPVCNAKVKQICKIIR